MVIGQKNNFRIKIVILVFYLVFGLIGLPLIFIFHPRNFLFEDNSPDDANKIYLFKNFASEIYDNINKKLIENMTLTKENETCPEDFETLVIKHQYYGNFTRFFGNSSFCIKRKDNPEWNLRRILERNEKVCPSSQKPCGIANRYSNALLCINKDEVCPLNDFDYITRDEEPYFQMADTIYKFTPKYFENDKVFLIIDIDLVFKYRLCLERFHRIEKLPCEFADDDLCYITDEVTNFKKNYPDIQHEDKIKLTPINLAHYNIKNDERLNHNYCGGAKNEDKMFLTFSKGFVNFDKEDLDNFLEEFNDTEADDSLSQICETYKTEYYLETLFNYFACVLLTWSVLHLVIQCLMFFLKNENILILIRKIFIWNGTILFIFKLICTSILIASHYSFYLKFKAVYLTIEEDPRNNILKKYKSLRRTFITKIFFIWIAGFIIIFIELILLSLIVTTSYIYIKDKEESTQNNNDVVMAEKPRIPENQLSDPFKFDKETNKKKENPSKAVIPQSDSQPNIQISNPYKNKINLRFQLKNRENNVLKIYEIKVDPDELFCDIEQKLKNQYSELKNVNMGVFRKDSEIINRQKTVKESNIEENALIIVDN